MSLRHAILGLLAIEAMSGYDLKKQIDESVGLMWSADQSQVYRTLAGLVDDGLATRASVAQETRPMVLRYAALSSGLAHARAEIAWVDDTLTRIDAVS